ncbi:MAG: hypothetical protein KDC93_14045 [Cyclobacteriaceae bacterium]|nr:hypothetical protein [Cyclobacteriaceae bacterium]
MDTTLYFITQIGFVAITVIFFGLVLKVIKNALAQSTIAADRQNKIFKNVIIGLTLWMVMLSILSIIGFFSDFSGFPPRFIIILLVPMITLVWSLLISKITKQLLILIPPQTIINLQVFRVFVEILLWMLFIQNLLPIQMTFEGRNFDIIAGITAPLVAYLAYSKNLLSKNMVIAWNFICLGLLLNIVLTAILSMPTPFRYFMNEPSNTVVAEFPIIFLPGFLVPLAYGLHFLSIRQLLNQKN